MPRILALYLTSIISGFCMMALEIVGARLLFPDFGSSVDVWAGVITVFILSLSVGYVLGGKIADRTRTNRALGIVLVLAGAYYALLTVWAQPFTNQLDALHNVRIGALVAALLLYLAPSLLLGMVSPMLVKLVFKEAEKVGSTTGTLYAVGSVGNVLGILVADYLMLTFLTINHSLIAMGIALVVTGSLHLLRSITGTIHQGEDTSLDRPQTARMERGNDQTPLDTGKAPA